MIKTKYSVDGSICSTLDYETNPNKYRGLITCLECDRKAWFIKGFTTAKIERTACFAAHHNEGCDASTVILINDDTDSEQGQDDHIATSDIRIDLDKTNTNSIYISESNDKHNEEESDWNSSPNKNATNGSSGFPLNKSLKQLLSNLCKNRDYAEKNQTITIVADSGRILIDGLLKDFIVPINDIKHEDVAKLRIFWGEINNLNEVDGDLWLNYGDYRKEPSIFMNSNLKNELIRNFKLKEISELDGSDVIVVGNAAVSPNGKIIIRTGFTKYISFRRYRPSDSASIGD
ncbi:hypothetical protein [Cellvibrio fibrivorans]|uniref:Uncharacterized protein n=1 Tax=Cellvibrio fibrivorans TaxID=126350 RepID=A0ABU1V497_9GAMM|nr:hypothetical protein [Cellvibrio fibrivorans]MDR7092215.1 hypothetical protein [Cellvibrio fibrivorans]